MNRLKLLKQKCKWKICGPALSHPVHMCFCVHVCLSMIWWYPHDNGAKQCLILSYLSHSLADRWGTTVDFTTSFLHSSAFRSSIFHSRPVHSSMLSSHCFLCLPLRLLPWTVPCRIVLASPDDHVTCPYHFSLRLFTKVRRSSYGPMAFPILVFTSSLAMWSLYQIPRSLQKHLISNACILLSMSVAMVLV